VETPKKSRAARPSVCIISHNAYGAMTGGRSGHIGGVERQTSMLAKWLVEQGYEVSMLTWDEGGPAEERIDGVRIIKICRKGAGLPFVRFFHPKWTGLISAMNRANADVYYHNCCEAETGEVAMWCKSHGKKFVFSTACDTDCQRDLTVLETPLERMLYRRGIKLARQIIVQTQTQNRLLRENFRLDSVVIPMPCPLLAQMEIRPAPGSGARILWIARVCEQKRPDRLLDLAKACPELTFDMVGPLYSDDYAQRVAARAKTMPNVQVHGPVPREKLDSLYKNAACFCSTSDFEGFPNTFLEAWGYGLPVVSTFDPDSIIQKHQLGMVAEDVPKLASALRSLLQSPARFAEIGRNARQYAFDHHRPEAVMPQFEEVFQQVCEK
jgi:glycosyltransferase involved in cell wall biosynthesis